MNEAMAETVVEWGTARSAVLSASIYPIGNAEYRARLNRLADAECALYALARGLPCFKEGTRSDAYPV